jgi:hypothetical protein
MINPKICCYNFPIDSDWEISAIAAQRRPKNIAKNAGNSVLF